MGDVDQVALGVLAKSGQLGLKGSRHNDEACFGKFKDMVKQAGVAQEEGSRKDSWHGFCPRALIEGRFCES